MRTLCNVHALGCCWKVDVYGIINILRPPFHRRHFQKSFFNENIWNSVEISLNFVPRDQINNIPSLVQMASQATSLYLNQWWLDYWCIYESLGTNGLICDNVSSSFRWNIGFDSHSMKIFVYVMCDYSCNTSSRNMSGYHKKKNCMASNTTWI